MATNKSGTFILNQPERLLVETRATADTSGRVAFYFITFCIGLSFILVRADWDYSLTGSGLSTQLPGITGINNLKGAIGKALMGILGVVLLLLPSRINRQYRVAPILFISGYLFLCISSVLWSVAPELTTRRLILLIIYTVGSLGIVHHLSNRQLLDTVIVVAIMFIALALTAELTHGTFTPQLSNYRFDGTMHSQHQGSLCAILVLAAYCGLTRIGSNRSFYLAALVIGVLFLVLTKSRINFIGCFLAVYLTSFWNTSFRKKLLLILILLVLICMAVLTTSLTAPDFLGELDVLVNMGRDLDTSDTLSLHGRLPIWASLHEYFLQRPVLGYGYQSFWTQDMIELFNYRMGWNAGGSSHALIIDILLQLGLVGALAYGLGFVSVFYWIVKDCIISKNSEIFFVFSLVLYAFILGMVESHLADPSNITAFFVSIAIFNCCISKEKIIND